VAFAHCGPDSDSGVSYVHRGRVFIEIGALSRNHSTVLCSLNTAFTVLRLRSHRNRSVYAHNVSVL
jgi:hypothetical protein